MRFKKASEIFAPVDPNLKVIDGGTRHKRWPKPLTQRDWEKSGGVRCPRCHKETVRFRPEDGVCIDCARWLNEQMERKENRQRKATKFIKAHNARIKKKRRRFQPLLFF